MKFNKKKALIFYSFTISLILIFWTMFETLYCQHFLYYCLFMINDACIPHLEAALDKRDC